MTREVRQIIKRQAIDIFFCVKDELRESCLTRLNEIIDLLVKDEMTPTPTEAVERPKTNAEKYRTAEERVEAFDEYCSKGTRNGEVPCWAVFAGKDIDCEKCQFMWLEQEVDNEEISKHED